MSAPIDSWLEAVLSGEPLDTIVSRFAEMGSGTRAEQIISSKTFNKRTIREVLVLAQIVTECGPITLRGAFYRAVSAGVYPDTDEKHYRQCGRIREAIESHIDQVEWAKLKDIELIERDTVRKTFAAPAWKAT